MDDFQKTWREHEVQLEQNRKFNLSVLREIKLNNAQSSLKGLLFLPISSLCFFTFTGTYALYFAYAERADWYFVFSGSVVALFSLLLVANAISQLRQLLSLDYDAPVLQLQKKLSRIRSSVLTNLRIAAWMLPFAPFVGLFLMKVFLDLDLTLVVGMRFIVSFGFITLLLEGLSLWLLSAFHPRKSYAWVNWLLQGSGSQVDEAMAFLEQIRAFETKEGGSGNTLH